MNKFKESIIKNKKNIIKFAIFGGVLAAYGAIQFNKGRKQGRSQAADIVQESVSLYELIHKQSLDSELGAIMKFLARR